jgi:hypothetical protein
MNKLVDFSEVEPKELQFSQPKRKDNMYFSHIFLKKRPLLVKSCKYICESSTDSKIVVQCKEEYLKNMFNVFIDRLEKRICQKTAHSCKNWFNGKEFTEQQIQDKFQSVFEGNKLVLSNTPNLTIYNQNNVEKESSDIKKGDIVVLIILVKGLWFSKDNLGLTLEVLQTKYFTKPVKVVEKLQSCVIDDKSEYSSENSDVETDSECEDERSEEQASTEEIAEVIENVTEIVETVAETTEQEGTAEEKEEVAKVIEAVVDDYEQEQEQEVVVENVEDETFF